MSFGATLRNGISIALGATVSLSASRYFSPLALFTSGTQGAWFDPSDVSTLFQDSAGTTPVTALGNPSTEQPVGLMLDKSQGLAQSQKLTNGNWSGNTTGWTKQVANFTATATGSGTVLINGITAAGVAQFWQSFATVVGRRYLVTGNIVSATNNSTFCALRKADDGGATTNIVDLCSGTGNGPVAQTVFSFVATAATTFIVLQVNDTGGITTATFSTISVIDVLGNHATQATAGNRPTYRARYNLLTFSEQFDNAIWAKVAGTITANQTTAPDGTLTADLYTADGTASQHDIIQNALTAYGVPNTWSICIKAGTQSIIQIMFDGNTLAWANFDLSAGTAFIQGSTGTAAITAVGNGFYRCSVTDVAGNSTGMRVLLVATTGAARFESNSLATTVYFWGAQRNIGSSATPYQSITTATSYNAVGFLPYLAFNGTSSAMATAAIDFSATNKATVFSGLTKLSDAAAAVAAEFTNTSLNVGSFYLGTPIFAAQASYTASIRGSIGTSTATSALSYAAPITNVVTGTYDLATPQAGVRVNGGSAVTNNTQGGGNFANDILYVGARAGTSLFFNGNIYSLIVRGASSTAAEIASTETWVNARTGAY
jgi:hypothetical protein